MRIGMRRAPCGYHHSTYRPNWTGQIRVHVGVSYATGHCIAEENPEARGLPYGEGGIIKLIARRLVSEREALLSNKESGLRCKVHRCVRASKE